MKYWFLENQARLLKEKEEINNLQLQEEWLEEVEWIFENGITLIANIRDRKHTYRVKLEFHSYFPSTPPTVTPLDKEINWSEHQYTDGTLCLEWGPDNWHSSVTGAQMLESTYKLIHSENPYGNKKADIQIPSRHFLTDGQRIRNKFIRLYINEEFLDKLTTLTQGEVVNISYTHIIENDAAVLHVLQIRKSDETIWDNSYLPSHFRPKEAKIGAILKTDLSKEKIKDFKTFTSVEKLYEDQNVEELSDIRLMILLDKTGDLHGLFSLDKDEEISVLPLVIEQKRKKRLPSDLEILKKKKIGIVGLGSLGSKVSISLGRMGVGKFYLVDDDIFMTGNIERHTLFLNSIATHKVDAIKRQLLNLSSQINVKVSRSNISGQEATSSLDNVLLNLGQCDLIIDATANPKAFNYISAVSVTNKVPMVWGEVFAGGIGGMIARSRPDLDPSPLTMRALFHGYTQDFPDFKYNNNTDPYMAEIDKEQVMIASDADVSVIASHMSKLSADSVLESKLSKYPYSMYLIGMANNWIFDAPFDTRPIKTDRYVGKEDFVSDDNEEENNKGIDFIISLLEKNQ